MAESNSGGFMTKTVEAWENLRTPPEIAAIVERNKSLWNPANESQFDESLATWADSIKSRLDELKPLEGNTPHLSIVAPAKDEEKSILGLLESVASQDYPNGIEVIIIANNCSNSDRTAEIARRVGATVIEYTLTDDNPDKKAAPIALARQKGLKAAQGDIIVSTDAETIMGPLWLRALTQPLDYDQTLGAVTGKISHFGREDAPYLLPYDTYNNERRKVGATTGRITNSLTWGANTAFRKEDALQVGGYDLGRYPGEDTQLGVRLSQVGKTKFVTDRNAEVRVSPRRMRAEGVKGLAKRQIVGNRQAYSVSNGEAKDYRE